MVMVNLPQAPVLDELLGVGDGRDLAVVVHDHVEDARLFHRAQHVLRFGQGVGERLLADQVLAGPRGGDGHGVVQVPGRRDVHDVDVASLDHPAPVGLDFLPTELPRRGFEGLPVSPADDFHPGLELPREKPAHLAVGVRMGLAHEFVADEGNVVLWHSLSPAAMRPWSVVCRGAKQ